MFLIEDPGLFLGKENQIHLYMGMAIKKVNPDKGHW